MSVCRAVLCTWQMFEQFGDVEEIFVMRGGSRSGMVCAFIRFGTQGMAQEAINKVHQKVTMKSAPEPLVVRWADMPGNRRRDAKEGTKRVRAAAATAAAAANGGGFNGGMGGGGNTMFMGDGGGMGHLGGGGWGPADGPPLYQMGVGGVLSDMSSGAALQQQAMLNGMYGPNPYGPYPVAQGPGVPPGGMHGPPPGVPIPPMNVNMVQRQMSVNMVYFDGAGGHPHPMPMGGGQGYWGGVGPPSPSLPVMSPHLSPMMPPPMMPPPMMIPPAPHPGMMPPGGIMLPPHMMQGGHPPGPFFEMPTGAAVPVSPHRHANPAQERGLVPAPAAVQV
jgi:hypothetical protein